MNEQDNTNYIERILEVEEAIRISKVICSVSEERLPLVLSIFEKAGVHINGLEELEEWKALKDMAYIVDMNEFVTELIKKGSQEEAEVYLRRKEFEDVCKTFNVKPSCAKRALHKKGLIKVVVMENGKVEYTVPTWTDGKVERMIVILKEAQHD